ncbi:MAG TPA: glycine cleavage T C-terminal barrel domain-containing protein, partial [Acidimicrobiia bacterium]|nr:glycine cleavage T C-terminal barrel domain-containing protein [Acidimicrobiia bacterium]
HCLATVDAVSYMRTCQVPAREGLRVLPHPSSGEPPLPATGAPGGIPTQTQFWDVVVIGQGESGLAAAAVERAAGRSVITIDAAAGQEAVGIYSGPIVVARTGGGMIQIHCREVVVATGASEVQPACPGNGLVGIVTARAAERLAAAAMDLGQTVTVRSPQRLIRFEGEGRVAAVIVDAPAGEQRLACDTAVVDLGRHPRDALARMGSGLNVRAVGDCARPAELPPSPVEGTVCPCSGVTVADLEAVWARGFHELELIKRATLAGTGTCQGSACLPHLRAFVRARGGEVPAPFTARPLSRQITMAEAAAGYHLAPVRRTALHDEHLRLGARMDRFGGWWRPWRYQDGEAEYWAVRRAVSLGDVGTLGKMLVSGPGATELLERLYPCRVADLRPGRARYTLLLDERGYVIEDGLICRDSETRFFLTFTSAGASFAEMWVRDWAETFGLDVRILDRTMSLGAINVTGPSAPELLARAGLASPPPYLGHLQAEVAGVECRVLRLSFTGEASFELHHPAEWSVKLWTALLELGADLGVQPHGLDALFKLRLEKGHVIIGMDTEFDSTPRRLGMEWAVKLDKEDFVGRQALLRTNALPLDKVLVGLELEGPAPFEGDVIRVHGTPVGQVTSSRYSGVLGKSVMLGWVKLGEGAPPDRVEVAGRLARRVPLPFYDPEGRRARG